MSPSSLSHCLLALALFVLLAGAPCATPATEPSVLAKGQVSATVKVKGTPHTLRITAEGVTLMGRSLRWPGRVHDEQNEGQQWTLVATGSALRPYLLTLEAAYNDAAAPSGVAFFGSRGAEFVPFEQVGVDQIRRGKVLVGGMQGGKEVWLAVDPDRTPARFTPVEADIGRIAIASEARPPRCQRLVEEVPGSEGAPSLPAGSWVRLRAVEGAEAEIEVGDLSSQEACDAGDQPRQLRVPFTALERSALLAHDFVPRLGGEPLITVGRTGALSHAGRVLLPANPELVGVTQSGGGQFEHWTVFTGDPEAPYLFLFSGAFSDMHGVAPWAVLLGGAKPRPLRPGLGDRQLPARLVEVTAEGVVVEEDFQCFFHVRSTWTFHGGAMSRVSGDMLGRPVEILADDGPSRLTGYSSTAGDAPAPLRLAAGRKLILRRFDFGSQRMLVSWKGEERWVDWKALKSALAKSLYAQGGCGAG